MKNEKQKTKKEYRKMKNVKTRMKNEKWKRIKKGRYGKLPPPEIESRSKK